MYCLPDGCTARPMQPGDGRRKRQPFGGRPARPYEHLTDQDFPTRPFVHLAVQGFPTRPSVHLTVQDLTNATVRDLTVQDFVCLIEDLDVRASTRSCMH